MITIEEIEEYPEGVLDLLSDYAVIEAHKLEERFKQLPNLSRKTWKLIKNGKIIMIAGLYYKSFLAVPELWVLTTVHLKPTDIRDLIQSLEFLKNHFPGSLRVRVELQVEKTGRFVEFFGFKKIQTENNYAVYEVN